jgi:hypothetical protein
MQKRPRGLQIRIKTNATEAKRSQKNKNKCKSQNKNNCNSHCNSHCHGNDQKQRNENNVLFALFLNKWPSDKIIPNIILFKLIGIFIIFLINLL